MTLDMTKMKERMDSLKNNGGCKNKDFWRPQDGEQTIRIVPTADGDPFKDFHFHYNVGANSGFLCPKRNFGDECPVCNFATKLYNEKTPESIKEAKSSSPVNVSSLPSSSEAKRLMVCVFGDMGRWLMKVCCLWY